MSEEEDEKAKEGFRQLIKMSYDLTVKWRREREIEQSKIGC